MRALGWRTLQHAVAAAPDGAVVTVRPGRYAGFRAGLTILANRAVSHDDKIYSALPPTVRIDYQLAFNAAGGPLAYGEGRGQTRSLATFRDWTGFEASGLQRAPRFRDPARADFRRAPGSAWTTGPPCRTVTAGASDAPGPATQPA